MQRPAGAGISSERHRDRAAYAVLVGAGLTGSAAQPIRQSRVFIYRTVSGGLCHEDDYSRRPRRHVRAGGGIGINARPGHAGSAFCDQPSQRGDKQRRRCTISAALRAAVPLLWSATVALRVSAVSVLCLRLSVSLLLSGTFCPNWPVWLRIRLVERLHLVGRRATRLGSLTSGPSRAARSTPARPRNARQSPPPRPWPATPDGCGPCSLGGLRNCGSRSRRSARPA